MSLTRKLLTGFGVMLALCLIISAAALIITRDLSGDLAHAATVTARRNTRKKGGIPDPFMRPR